jgi:uncharacterized protein YbjT (DUF2867 family)
MILVKGATGDIGSKVLRRLSEVGIRVRALSRTPERGEALPHVEWARTDLAEPETLPAVFAGADRLFLLTGNVRSMTTLQKNAIDAAAAASIEHMVKLSARGAQPGSKSAIGRWHHEVETYLKDSGLRWTMLRPHVFMQNLLDQAPRIREDGELRAASGDGRIPFIDTRDIADAAVAALTEEDHAGETYILTGGAALDYDQVADIVGTAIDRPVRYVAESFEEARTRLQNEGIPGWLIDSRLALAYYQRADRETARLARGVFELTGHPPRSMIQFAYDYRNALVPTSDEIFKPERMNEGLRADRECFRNEPPPLGIPSSFLT